MGLWAWSSLLPSSLLKPSFLLCFSPCSFLEIILEHNFFSRAQMIQRRGGEQGTGGEIRGFSGFCLAVFFTHTHATSVRFGSGFFGRRGFFLLGGPCVFFSLSSQLLSFLFFRPIIVVCLPARRHCLPSNLSERASVCVRNRNGERGKGSSLH